MYLFVERKRPECIEDWLQDEPEKFAYRVGKETSFKFGRYVGVDHIFA
jgi:hypothetical protein